MNKNYLINKAKLRYIGRHFDGFQKEKPYMTFLGYDCGDRSAIWADYLGKIIFVLLNDVELALHL